MPIIPKIGRKRTKIRSLIIILHMILLAGAATMVYPFLLMLSGSLKGNLDMSRMDVIPEVLYSRKTRFARFLEERYIDRRAVAAAYWRDIPTIMDATIPKIDQRDLRTFRAFLRQEGARFPDHFYWMQEGCQRPGLWSRNARRIRDMFKEECGTIEEFNRRYGQGYSSWNDFRFVEDQPLVREFSYEDTPIYDRFLEFKRGLSTDEKVVFNIDGLYYIAQQKYPSMANGRIDRNRILQAACPTGPEREIWADYVKHQLNCLFVNPDAQGLRLFRESLSGQFNGSLRTMNNALGTDYSSFNAIKVRHEDFRKQALFVAYTRFVADVCPPEHLIVDTPSTRYRKFVGSKTATIPFAMYEYRLFSQQEKPFMREILTRNYRSVMQYVSVYGRAIVNTVIFLGLSILGALTVNPVTAYALSRFKLRSTYALLMFFLLTMAFPGSVTMLPNFLLLKKFHLLNTYWALILPGLANGFNIFLLKGFFDSIPKEVYESAMLDGAGEWTMFWRFTMALSKPILTLITFGAFTGAYSAFMFALLICPDEKMWTLMVWLYQLQQQAIQPVVYAALVLAAIPTLLVFILAQNTIMKGIVVPVEKYASGKMRNARESRTGILLGRLSNSYRSGICPACWQPDRYLDSPCSEGKWLHGSR